MYTHPNKRSLLNTKFNMIFKIIVGDFNAKTAVLEDFSEPDETFLNVMDVNVEDGLFRYHIADYQVFLDNNISLKRYTQCECRPNNSLKIG
jgi:hypothetical protein